MMPTTVAARAAARNRGAADESIVAAERQALRESLSYLVCVLYRDLMGSMEKRTAAYGVTASQWRFLRALYVEEGVTQRELSVALGVREPSTVKALARLERDGFVKRVTNSADRRKVNVHLTAKARKLVQMLLPFVIEVNELSLSRFSPAEEQALRGLLVKAVKNLAADQAPPAGD